MTPTDTQRAQARRAARYAARRGSPITACPYPTDGPDVLRVLAVVFVREYARLIPGSIDHTA
ncbi:MAG: Rmf/CrpP fold protein [Stackebrandtia sp.]